MAPPRVILTEADVEARKQRKLLLQAERRRLLALKKYAEQPHALERAQERRASKERARQALARVATPVPGVSAALQFVVAPFRRLLGAMQRGSGEGEPEAKRRCLSADAATGTAGADGHLQPAPEVAERRATRTPSLPTIAPAFQLAVDAPASAADAPTPAAPSAAAVSAPSASADDVSATAPELSDDDSPPSDGEWVQQQSIDVEPALAPFADVDEPTEAVPPCRARRIPAHASAAALLPAPGARVLRARLPTLSLRCRQLAEPQRGDVERTWDYFELCAGALRFYAAFKLNINRLLFVADWADAADALLQDMIARGDVPPGTRNLGDVYKLNVHPFWRKLVLELGDPQERKRPLVATCGYTCIVSISSRRGHASVCCSHVAATPQDNSPNTMNATGEKSAVLEPCISLFLAIKPDVILFENGIKAWKNQAFLFKQLVPAGWDIVRGNFSAGKIGHRHERNRFFLMAVRRDTLFRDQLQHLLFMTLEGFLPPRVRPRSVPLFIAVEDRVAKKLFELQMGLLGNMVVSGVARVAFVTLLARLLHMRCPLVLPERRRFPPIEMDPNLRPPPLGAIPSPLSDGELDIVEAYVKHSGLKPTWLTHHGLSNRLTTRTNRENGTFARFSRTYDDESVEFRYRYDPWRINPNVATLDMGAPAGFVTANIPNLLKLARKLCATRSAAAEARVVTGLAADAAANAAMASTCKARRSRLAGLE